MATTEGIVQVLQGRIKKAAGLGLAAAILHLLGALSSAPSTAASAATLFSPSVSCFGETAELGFAWLPASGGGHQWVDVSLFDNDFAEGSYIGAGPLQSVDQSFSWPGFRKGLRHFWRVTSVINGEWTVSATASFTPCGSAALPPPPPAAPLTISPTLLERELFDAQNEERARFGLPPLWLDNTLVLAARQRAHDMATKQYFSHYSPTGESAFTLLGAAHVPYSLASENIARNNHPDSRSAAVALSGFMASAAHRENILERAFSTVGVGVATQGDMKYFAVIFVRP